MFVAGPAGPELPERSVDFAVDRAKTAGAGMRLVHAIEWSPHTSMTVEELAEQHGVRAKRLAQRRSSIRPMSRASRSRSASPG